ncbi:6-phosphogluconate dehydrogenase [Vararia minispora EC-137]|uniref:6-phosphogluconate dehydrogenase n=1 Tax=Vararia minispora EC-137 TaxID=1314806 RepID=A0ACB8QZT9_9AGAM|nr:6-phosphogluconate dehydrogenase [Vararia minispora EC-137]
MAVIEAPKSILLVGYGAVGMAYTLILERGGAEVTVVARSNFDAVTEHGLDIYSEKYGEHLGWRPHRVVPCVPDACDRAYDYAIITTKAIPELVNTSASIVLAPLFNKTYTSRFPQPVYVNMQNGLDVERDLYETLEARGLRPRVVGTAVYIGTKTGGKNVLIHSHFDRMSLGMYRYDDYTTAMNTPEEDAILSDLASLLVRGGSTAITVPDIQRVKFTKNFWNVAFSSMSALSRFPLTALFRSRTSDDSSAPPSVKQAALLESHTIPTVRALLMELVALGHAIGWPDDLEKGVSAQFVENTIENTAALHQKPGNGLVASMLVDVLEGRPIEVEAIFGSVVRLARKYGVETPRLDMLYGILLVVQNQMLRKTEGSL